MQIHFQKAMMIGLLGCGLALGFGPYANATPLPGLTNLNFLSYTGSAPKNSFSSVDPVGWTGGTGQIFIVAPGTTDVASQGLRNYLPQHIRMSQHVEHPGGL